MHKEEGRGKAGEEEIEMPYLSLILKLETIDYNQIEN